MKNVGIAYGLGAAIACGTAATAQPITYTESNRSAFTSAEIIRGDPDGGGDPIIISDDAFDSTILQGPFSTMLSASVSDLGDAGMGGGTVTSDLGASSIMFDASTSATSVGVGRGSAGASLFASFSLSQDGLYDLTAGLTHTGGDLFGGLSGGASVLLERDTGETQMLPGFPFPVPIFETIIDLSAANSNVATDEMRTLVAGDYMLSINLFSSSEEASLNTPDNASASFAMTLVPGPAPMVAAGLGGLLAMRRRR